MSRLPRITSSTARLEQAGDKTLTDRAADGGEQRIMSVAPGEIHERCAVIAGSADEADHVLRHL